MSVWDFFDTKLYINLDHRTDRNEQALEEFNRVGLVAERVPGVLAENRTLGFNESQHNALLRGIGKTLILEDDVVFKNYNHLELALIQLPEDWDILYLGANIQGTDLCSWALPVRHSSYLFRITQAWTTHAVAYSPKGLEYVLSTWDYQNGQIYDDFLRCNIEKLNTFIVGPQVADQRPGFSDIWQRPVDYGMFKGGNDLMAMIP